MKNHWSRMVCLAMLIMVGVGESRAESEVPALAVPPSHLDRFLEQCAGRGLQAQEAQTMTVRGLDGWLFLGSELRHVGCGKFWGEDAKAASQSTRPENADPVPAIVDFNDQLKAEGIRLILMPVPPKVVVYPDKLMEEMDGAGPRVDIFHQAFYRQLQEAGVEVLDVTDRFRTERGVEGDPLYCRQDTHWSGRGCEVAAQELLGRIGRPDWLKDCATSGYEKSVRTLEMSGDLWQALEDPSIAKETLSLHHVVDAAGEPMEPAEDSPVILMGDSHCLVFHAGDDMHARGAGLADQLAYGLGCPIELLGTRGSGSTAVRVDLFRRWKRSPDYYEGKKIVVWCLTARDFSESISGWKVVPIKK